LSGGGTSQTVMAHRPSGAWRQEDLHDVVPERAVLTELARGFLLVRENDRQRAVRFAATFLREQAEPLARPAPAAYPAAAPAQRSLGLEFRGAVERPDPRGPR